MSAWQENTWCGMGVSFLFRDAFERKKIGNFPYLGLVGLEVDNTSYLGTLSWCRPPIVL